MLPGGRTQAAECEVDRVHCAVDITRHLAKMGDHHPAPGIRFADPKIYHPLNGLLGLGIITEPEVSGGQELISVHVIRPLAVQSFGPLQRGAEILPAEQSYSGAFVRFKCRWTVRECSNGAEQEDETLHGRKRRGTEVPRLSNHYGAQAGPAPAVQPGSP